MPLKRSVWRCGLCLLWVTGKGEVLAMDRNEERALWRTGASWPAAYPPCIWRNGYPASEGNGSKYRMENFFKETNKNTNLKKKMHH